MEFDEWFNEVELFGLRSERFYDDLYAYKFDGASSVYMVKWLKAAYEVGYEKAKNDNL